MNTHEIKKKAVLGVFIVVAMLTMPSVLAERHIGTNFILEVEQFSGSRYSNGTNFRTLSANDDVPQFMENKTNFDLKNWFYRIMVIPISPINCIVDILQPMARNYTYSINIPLEYTINASNLTWVEIVGIKSSQNITLSGLLSGSEQFDVPYDDVYTVTVYGNVSGGTCNAIATFIVDRTSEFAKSKPSLLGIIILGLFSIALYIFYLSRYFTDYFKPLFYAISSLFVYAALSITSLAAREYSKITVLNSNIGNIISVAIYVATLIAMIMLVLFIVNIMRRAQEIKYG